MTRQLLGILALAASASIAAAQQPAGHQKAKAKARVTSTSTGEVGRMSGLRATPRDYVRADDTRGDDLWRREQMMDQKCGKDRERCGRRM